jgi:predicted HNH restriction endonuclease
MAHQTGQSHHELIAKQNAGRRYERFTPMQVHDPLYETKKTHQYKQKLKLRFKMNKYKQIKTYFLRSVFTQASTPLVVPKHLVDEISQTAPVDDHALIKEQVHKSEQEIKRLVDENRKMSEDSKIKDAHIAAIEAEKQSRELALVKDVKMGNVHRQKNY